MNKLLTATSAVILSLIFHASACATVIINDEFDDGNLTTNTTGTGTGFTDRGQNGTSETGGNAVSTPGGSATAVIESNDKFDPFQNGVTTRSTWSITSASITNSQYRTWVGLRNALSSSDHFLPGVPGLYVSIFQFSGDVLGANTTQGNLVATNQGGASTVLATWNWGFSNSSGLLDIILDTDNTSYTLNFSQSISLVSGSLTGGVAAVGTLGANFEVGFHNQWSGNTLSMGSISVETLDASVPTPSGIALLVIGLAGLTKRRLFRR